MRDISNEMGRTAFKPEKRSKDEKRGRTEKKVKVKLNVQYKWIKFPVKDVNHIFLKVSLILLKREVLVVQSRPTRWPHGLWPARLLCPWNSPGKNTGVGGRALIQGICQIQGLNPGPLHCRRILYCLRCTNKNEREVGTDTQCSRKMLKGIRNINVRQSTSW